VVTLRVFQKPNKTRKPFSTKKQQKKLRIVFLLFSNCTIEKTVAFFEDSRR
jgi:hypothetical protein